MLPRPAGVYFEPGAVSFLGDLHENTIASPVLAAFAPPFFRRSQRPDRAGGGAPPSPNHTQGRWYHQIVNASFVAGYAILKPEGRDDHRPPAHRTKINDIGRIPTAVIAFRTANSNN